MPHWSSIDHPWNIAMLENQRSGGVFWWLDGAHSSWF